MPCGRVGALSHASKRPAKEVEDGPPGAPPSATALARHCLAHQPNHMPSICHEVDHPDADRRVGI
eukprot:11918723-Alexandrium_andersonii.AAC.1